MLNTAPIDKPESSLKEVDQRLQFQILGSEVDFLFVIGEVPDVISLFERADQTQCGMKLTASSQTGLIRSNLYWDVN
jgi:hypothetical protein